MRQIELRMFAPWVEPARLPEAEVEALTFEQCLARALELGLRRFDRKTLATYCGIHYPHFSDVIAGKRPFHAVKLNAFCMFTGCDYPRQWLAIQARRAEEQYRRLSQQAIGDYVQQMFATRQAVA
ncbi:hypothetical protein NFI99_23730 [Burkholderia glumae]|uniref:XRE family transcriptional regulator n=1 Tax=Burkholderia glumae TaxID=337 RepID=A0ABY5BC92_BURGL|nr:hypothetical protein [Burkholderia glumae]KHJ64685.1 hypothetical protein NCPPB3923_01530 [Burkholderia glumae]USS44641.1 hypothetical protein NFI99_23730 [Burkholderia glumae]